LRAAEALARIIEALEPQGFDYVFGSEPPTFEGSVVVLERPLRLRITFGRLDFTRLPRVYVVDRQAELPGHHAHVEDDDSICYSSPGTLILDPYKPGEHALTVLGLAKRTLGEILSGTAERDLATEFPQHWRGVPVHVVLPPDAPQGKASVARIPRLGTKLAFILARSARGREEGLDLGVIGTAGGEASKAFIVRTAAYLHLAQGEILPTTLAGFLDWADRIDVALRPALMRGVVAADGVTFLFVLAPNGCVGVFTVPPEGWIERRRPTGELTRLLRERPGEVRVTRARGIRADLPLVMGRNLGRGPSLSGRRIILVGCGTIGSHLAKFLAQSGAGYDGGSLKLVDEQSLTAANIGRHWLHPRHIGSGKAEACAAELSAIFPGSEITARGQDAMESLDRILEADLLIDATGEEPLSVALNDAVVHARGQGPAFLTVWLRGMGAAAQALFVPRDQGDRGCLRCLRPRAGAWPVLDVMRAEAPEGEEPAACGEAAFLPYGVAASAIAAGLAAKMALDWAGGEVHPSFRTLRVDLGSTDPVADLDLPRDPVCPACGRP